MYAGYCGLCDAATGTRAGGVWAAAAARLLTAIRNPLPKSASFFDSTRMVIRSVFLAHKFFYFMEGIFGAVSFKKNILYVSEFPSPGGEYVPASS